MTQYPPLLGVPSVALVVRCAFSQFCASWQSLLIHTQPQCPAHARLPSSSRWTLHSDSTMYSISARLYRINHPSPFFWRGEDRAVGLLLHCGRILLVLVLLDTWAGFTSGMSWMSFCEQCRGGQGRQVER